MLLRAKDSFAGQIDTRRFVVKKGQLIDEDHPIAVAHADCFEQARADIPAWEVEEPSEVVEEPQAPIKDDLESKGLSNLQYMAVKMGVSSQGTKAALIERIRKHRANQGG